MTTKIAINGFGRIGRCITRLLFERNDDVELVAINTSGPDLDSLLDNIAYLLSFDSVHGQWDKEVVVNADGLVINGHQVKVTTHLDPTQCSWGDLGVDIVLECTGIFTSRDRAELHLQAGAKKVLISAPGSGVDATVVFGVNHRVLTQESLIVSNASCTTNCLAPIVKVIDDLAGVESGLMNTIHAVTSDQSLADGGHKDWRRGRAAMSSMIPTATGAAKAIDLVLPNLAGRLDGFAIRVPTANVSLVDLTVSTKQPVSVQRVNEALKQASQTSLQGVLAVNEAPLVSIDFNGNSASSIADLTQTRKQNQMLKVLSWYDNEYGFSNRMIDTAKYMGDLK